MAALCASIGRLLARCSGTLEKLSASDSGCQADNLNVEVFQFIQQLPDATLNQHAARAVRATCRTLDRDRKPAPRERTRAGKA